MEGEKGTHTLTGLRGHPYSIMELSEVPRIPLRHYADQRISLDLDVDVKIEYGKFGNLLAEVKTVTGGEE